MNKTSTPVSSGTLRFGFACIPLGLPQPIIASCKLPNATPSRLNEIIQANLHSLNRCLDYVSGLGFELFRINSGIIPFASHPVNRLSWWKDYKDQLQALGKKSKKLNLRLSMHPGQFTVLNSPNPKVVKASILELEYHARFMDALELPLSSKIVIHLGGVYGDKQAALQRLTDVWKSLPPEIKNRLVLENDERLYSIYDALVVGENLNAPVVFDRFHHRIHGDPLKTPLPELITRTIKTWTSKDGRPKVHFSSQEPGAKPGTHDIAISESEFNEFLKESKGFDLDVMIEARGKEEAALIALKAARAAKQTA